MAGVSVGGKIEGTSLVSLLAGKPAAFRRSEQSLLFHYPHYGLGPKQKPQTALIVGNFKLLKDLETDKAQLFDLDADLSEKNDLAANMPEKAREMELLTTKRLEMIDAQAVAPNPNFDSEAIVERRGRRGGR